MRPRLLACLVVVSFWPGTSLALGKGEASLSGGVGLSVGALDGARLGPSLEAKLLRGMSDAWAGRLGVQLAWLPTSSAAGDTFVALQELGFTWAADVVNLVPQLDLGLAVATIAGGGAGASERLGPQLGIGADYLLNRRWALSGFAHVDYLPLRIAGSHRSASLLATFSLDLTRYF